jgi:hypothetical protein
MPVFPVQNLSKQDAYAGIQGAWCHYQHTALLWNPLRLPYYYEEKASWHAHEGCHHVAQQHPLPCSPCTPGHVPIHVLEDVRPSSYSLDLSLCDFHVFSTLKKAQKGLLVWARQKRQGCCGAVVPAVDQGVLYGGDPSAGVSWDACLSAHGDYF